eukprot:10738104-Alexandrium_andersonii.AAC.1
MSASLVGSEMCIRDSPARAGCLHRCMHIKAGVVQNVASLRPLGEEGASCLLYTSDAADDM